MTANRQSPQPGDPAPDVTLQDEQCNLVRLSGFWRQSPVALVFFRHFG